jgi:hypothetical protein
MDTKPAAVYAAISAVTAALAERGVGKNRKNHQQGYAFRGVDDVYQALSPLLAKHGLVMLPRVVSRAESEHATKSGGTQFRVVLEVDYDLVGVADGSRHVVRVIGEAQDSADKASNKAMSAAYKYAAFQVFAIPVEGVEDADATTPEPVTRRESPTQKAARQAAHDPSWEVDRAAFCAALANPDIDSSYDVVAVLCASLGRPRPSAMTAEARAALLAWLRSEKGQAALSAIHDSKQEAK